MLALAFRAIQSNIQASTELLSRAYLAILFLPDGTLGLLFLAGTFIRPQVGLFGLLALVSAILFARLLGVNRETWKNGLILANPLLVGLGLGSTLALTWPAALFVAVMGAGALVVTLAVNHVLSRYCYLPVLTLPFVLVLMVGSLASLRYSGLVLAGGQPVLTDAFLLFRPEIDGFLRSLGAIVFVPHPVAGLLFAVILLAHSRILFLLAVSGWIVGTVVRSILLGATAPALAHLGGYNFILTAMLVGGISLVPSLRSYAIALLGVIFAAIVLDSYEVCWARHGLPAYALPFNVVVLGLLYTLGLVGYSRLPMLRGRTPEETLEIDLALRWRYPGNWRTLRLPLLGRWSVWQGFDGPWTHHGDYRYGYDFVILGENGQTHSGNGANLTDYHCYRCPVTAPVSGRVVVVIDYFPDNPPGPVQSGQNWGNVVILHDERGFFVVLAHLAQGSAIVAPGAWVEVGTRVAHCGNSGFSPQPHLHVQVQANAILGAPTLPFSWAGYLNSGRFESRGLPEVGQSVEPLRQDTQEETALDFLLGDELVYRIFHRSKEVGELRLVVRVANDGTLYFESDQGGRLYFGKQDGAFLFYRTEGKDPYLKFLQRSLPRLPLQLRSGLSWRDTLPAGLYLRGLLLVLVQVAASLVPELARVTCELSVDETGKIHCTARSAWLPINETTELQLDKNKGPVWLCVGPWKLIRHGETA